MYCIFQILVSRDEIKIWDASNLAFSNLSQCKLLGYTGLLTWATSNLVFSSLFQCKLLGYTGLLWWLHQLFPRGLKPHWRALESWDVVLISHLCSWAQVCWWPRWWQPEQQHFVSSGVQLSSSTHSVPSPWIRKKPHMRLHGRKTPKKLLFHLGFGSSQWIYGI